MSELCTVGAGHSDGKLSERTTRKERMAKKWVDGRALTSFDCLEKEVVDGERLAMSRRGTTPSPSEARLRLRLGERCTVPV